MDSYLALTAETAAAGGWSVDSYCTLTAVGEAELIEKRSRFLARAAPVDSEAAAKEEIARIRAKHHDARHCCWCYTILGGPERCSDDGEPQGTAGLPMLEVFRRGGIFNVCCTVTRYFGGILLGPGGLSRAYSASAGQALADAGVSEMRLRDCVEIACPYNLLARVRTEIGNIGGSADDIIYGENILIRALLPAGRTDDFNKRLADASAGAVTGVLTGRRFAGL